MLEKIIAFVVVFGVLVFVHELGHFLLAKRAGILCREFALGMGPKIARYKRGETEYTLRLLPIGGLVRMAGEDPEMDFLKTHMEIAVRRNENGQVTHLVLDPGQWDKPGLIRGKVLHHDLEKDLVLTLETDGKSTLFNVHPQAHLVLEGYEVQIAPLNRQFRGKTVAQRFWAIFAGPAANFVLAFLLLTSLGLFHGVPVNEPVLGTVVKGGPADQSGLKEGDRILKIDNRTVDSWQEVVTIISASPGKQMKFLIQREGREITLPVKVGRDPADPKVGKIQVSGPVTKSPLQALEYGFKTTYQYTALIFTGLVKLVSGGVGLDELSGPLGIAKMTGDFAQQGLETLVRWAAILSINLGLFNLLPLPALDGGRLTFLGVEALRGKPVDPTKEGMVHFLGFAFLMLLILFVTWNDVQRFFF